MGTSDLVRGVVMLLFLHLPVRTASAKSNATIHWKGHDYPKGHLMEGVRVPFYLYNGPGFDAFWDNCERVLWSKGVEVSWLMRLQDHPWRTASPDQAALFIIPAMFSVAFKDKAHCTKPLGQMADALYQQVQSSPYYRRHWGKDHLMVVSYFKAEGWMTNNRRWRSLARNITIATHSLGYLKLPPSTCHVTVGHQTGSLHDVDSVSPPPPSRTLFFLGHTFGHEYYKLRRIALDSLGNVGQNNFIAASDCENGKHYPMCRLSEQAVTRCCLAKKLPFDEYLTLLAKANFSLNIHGGDAGSSRTFDAIMVGVPQLILSDSFFSEYAPFQCVVPWRRFTHAVRGRDFQRDPVGATMKALTQALPRRNAMLAQQDHHKRDLLWLLHDSVAANNLMVQVVKQCFNRSWTPSRAAAKDFRKARDAKCVNIAEPTPNIAEPTSKTGEPTSNTTAYNPNTAELTLTPKATGPTLNAFSPTKT